MRLTHTYSAVLHDPATGTLGVAVQSHWFNVGRIVPWVRPGAGAVATQAMAEPNYGPRGLDLMGNGLTADAALEQLLAADDERELRQVAFVDATGGVAAHTGSRCIRYASHITGEGWSVQANIMRDDAVVPAMAETIASAPGDTADRLLATLEAAERSGGDLRGSQSAALVVCSAGPVAEVDLHVEDHPDPVGELRRLLSAHRAYEHMDKGDGALAAGDTERAAREYAAAANTSDNPEVLFWQAFGLAEMNRETEAVPALRRAAAANADLIELLRRLPEAELTDAGRVERLLEALQLPSA
jgi:uncharacterized Ntn-hydrolase superfamily protein